MCETKSQHWLYTCYVALRLWWACYVTISNVFTSLLHGCYVVTYVGTFVTLLHMLRYIVMLCYVVMLRYVVMLHCYATLLHYIVALRCYVFSCYVVKLRCYAILLCYVFSYIVVALVGLLCNYFLRLYIITSRLLCSKVTLLHYVDMLCWYAVLICYLKLCCWIMLLRYVVRLRC